MIQKFTKQQAIDIYQSCELIDDLARNYNVTRYNILSIKRRIYYKSATSHILDLPGYCDIGSGKKFPIPIDLIEKIFYDTGDYNHFWNTYRATRNVVLSIKRKKSFKKITSKLGQPGQIKRYGMTQELVEEVYNSKGTYKELAEKYNIHYNTIRNIKSKSSRAFNMWEEF